MSGGSLMMIPGTYYIDGGGITTNSSASITGAGVFIYNGGSSVGSIKLTGSSSVILSPPPSGTYAGMSIFQDRTSTAALSLTGSGGIQITGGIYAAKAASTLTGSSSTTIDGSFLIVDSRAAGACPAPPWLAALPLRDRLGRCMRMTQPGGAPTTPPGHDRATTESAIIRDGTRP
jgi:hypothetical protein